MKQYPWKMKIRWDGIDWWQSEKTLDTDYYFYYFKWDWISKEGREARKKLKWKLFGINKFWYDGPHVQLDLYFFCFYWTTPYTSWNKDDWK